MAIRSEWVVSREKAQSRGGMVAAKTPYAADAGAAVLAGGGNAVDAAVTTSFVAGVVEPWMNGLGGGGYMVIHRPGEEQAKVVSYPMIAPAGATEDMFPLGGSDKGFFGWPAVVGNANVAGPRSVAVPGTVAGLALALEQFGTISLADAINPAIEFAERRLSGHLAHDPQDRAGSRLTAGQCREPRDLYRQRIAPDTRRMSPRHS